MSKASCILRVLILGAVALVLLASSWPGVALGVAVAAPADQAFPAVAFDGTNYLVVWEDGRTGTYTDIYGARVSKSGVALDPDGFAISMAWHTQARPAVAFDGTNYLVVWHDYRSNTYYSVYFARVSPAGVVLDSDGIRVCATASQQMWPAVAFDGTNYLVVWQDLRSGNFDIYGARVSKSGVVLEPNGFAVSTAAARQAHPAVAFDGVHYLVVWDDQRTNISDDIYGSRVNPSGGVLDSKGVAISTAANRQEYPSVTYGGGNYLVAWQDDRSGFEDIYGTRVTPSAGVLNSGGIAICRAANNQAYPALGFDGTNYMAVWQDYRAGYYFDIYGARIGVSGSVLDTAGIAISLAGDDQLAPALGYDGANYMVFWQDNRGETYDVYAARVECSGAVLDPGGLTDVLVASVTANVEAGCVAVSWQTTSEVPASSFSVERADSREGTFAVLGSAVLTSDALSFSVTDCSVTPGGTFWYRVVLEGDSGAREVYGPIEVAVDAAPSAYMAYDAYPNPFNPSCTMRYDLPEGATVSLRVFDVSGTLVRTLVEGWRGPGVHNETWDGRADDGSSLASGIYFYSIKAGELEATKKMLLLR
jgi:hypothetical protein